jgi:hypothetical protein
MGFFKAVDLGLRTCSFLDGSVRSLLRTDNTEDTALHYTKPVAQYFLDYWDFGLRPWSGILNKHYRTQSLGNWICF